MVLRSSNSLFVRPKEDYEGDIFGDDPLQSDNDESDRGQSDNDPADDDKKSSPEKDFKAIQEELNRKESKIHQSAKDHVDEEKAKLAIESSVEKHVDVANRIKDVKLEVERNAGRKKPLNTTLTAPPTVVRPAVAPSVNVNPLVRPAVAPSVNVNPSNDSQSYWKTVTDADVKGPKAKIILALKYTDGGDTCEKNGVKMENFFKMALYDALANSGLQALVRVKCITSIGEQDNRFHLMQLGVSPQIFSDYQLLNSDTESAIEASMKTYMDKHSYKFRVLSAIGATKKNEIGVQMTGPVNCGVGSDWNNGLIWDHQGSLTKQMSETNTNLQDALSILEPNLEKPIVSKIVYIRPVENKIHMKFIAHLQAHRDDIDDLAKQKNILKSLNEVLKCEGKKVTGTRVTMWNGKWKPIY